ncbi:MAG TPA: hypothetical protein VD947_03210 [Patescibacteria group bacterium]|nr:hypothetical protein [Patescibacteria group bacterium]
MQDLFKTSRGTPEQLPANPALDRHHSTRWQEDVCPNFPLTGPELAQENTELLESTINASEEVKQARYDEFSVVWAQRWRETSGNDYYFATGGGESPFAQYSSKGWKLHIPFKKSHEEEVSRFLYGAGLYFKTETSSTFTHGFTESGSTVYVGSWDCMRAIAGSLEALEPVLSDGTIEQRGDKIIHVGSGSDVEVPEEPRITARFDVQKTRQGGIGGSKKYSEKGLPSWANLVGILSALPLLTQDAQGLLELEERAFKPLPRKESDSLFAPVSYQKPEKVDLDRLVKAYREAENRARRELFQDFGKEFVVGKEAQY